MATTTAMGVQEGGPVAIPADKPQSSDEEDEFQLLVIAARLGRVKLINDLLDCAVGPRRLSLGKSVESPLHAAARREHLQVAKLIAEVGGLQLAAARDAEGQTPVDVAGTQTRDFLKEALDRGAATYCPDDLQTEQSWCGHGTFGTVYKCVVKATGMPAVLKVFNNGLASEEEEMVDRQRERTLLSLLHHPRIIKYLGYWERSAPPVQQGVLMQRADGDLPDYLEDREEAGADERWSVVRRAALQVAEGLKVLHEHPYVIMHRDLHVGNVLYIGNDFVLGDFGTAKTLTRSAERGAMYTRHTAEKGRLTEMPPEAAGSTGIRYSTAIDLYYYGSILVSLLRWAMAMGLWEDSPNSEAERVLWKDQALEQAHHQEWPAVAHLVSSLASDCLAEEPDERPTARQAYERLRDVSIEDIGAFSKAGEEKKSSGEQAEGCVGKEDDDLGVTALMNAAKAGQANVVRRLLRQKDADMCCEGKDGRTALMLAAEEGHAKVVTLLLDHPGGSTAIDAYDKSGETALALAAKRGHEEVVEELLRRGADIHKEADDGWPPLVKAIFCEKERVAKVLLNHGARIEPCPQLFTAVGGDDIRVVELFLRLGVNKDQTDEHGSTALMWAAQDGLKDIVTLLLGVGANVRARTSSGQTALMRAVRSGEREIAGMLLQRLSPEDIDSQDNDGWTALEHAARQYERWHGHEDKYKAMVEILLEHGANPFVDYRDRSAAWGIEVAEQASDDEEDSPEPPDATSVVRGLIRQAEDRMTGLSAALRQVLVSARLTEKDATEWTAKLHGDGYDHVYALRHVVLSCKTVEAVTAECGHFALLKKAQVPRVIKAISEMTSLPPPPPLSLPIRRFLRTFLFPGSLMQDDQTKLACYERVDSLGILTEELPAYLDEIEDVLLPGHRAAMREWQRLHANVVEPDQPQRAQGETVLPPLS